MSISIKDEKQALTKDEFETVAKTRYPEISAVDQKELAELVKRLRTLRDKAQDLARQQRREVRGKAEPRGKSAAKSSDSQKLKTQIFANALKRVNVRLHKLEKTEKHAALVQASKRALERKQQAMDDASNGGRPSPGHYRNRGMRPVTNPKGTVGKIGSERGRVSQFVKNSQAKKDNRQSA